MKIKQDNRYADEKIAFILVFLRFFGDHQFHAKSEKGKQLEKQMFNMNYLNENIIAQNVANNAITSPFGMGEGLLNKVIITETCGQL